MIRDSKQRGVAALLSIVVIAVLLLVIGIFVLSSGFIQTQLGVGTRETSTALFAAEGGVNDALMKIIRDPRFTTSCAPVSPCLANFCLLSVASGVSNPATACVQVSGTWDGTAAATKIISSEGIFKGKKRRIKVEASVTTLGKVTPATFAEVESF